MHMVPALDLTFEHAAATAAVEKGATEREKIGGKRKKKVCVARNRKEGSLPGLSGVETLARHAARASSPFKSIPKGMTVSRLSSSMWRQHPAYRAFSLVLFLFFYFFLLVPLSHFRVKGKEKPTRNLKKM
ncbi:hypothetical protein DAPPUDRAFT_307578 [Daphnia pulex]|uniref:Transmembrane protein n=1 Tax=Daphnia pulex TaxID=6669 RepID=E9H399_DAPPU|nr:hypothetical protein DAPPUDRAFT_307578 [Daphnia pulex]|eukprot:EFX73725.1 hypothetical protein DAPPUDRAFT_307578 [Daphnia pulex]